MLLCIVLAVVICATCKIADLTNENADGKQIYEKYINLSVSAEKSRHNIRYVGIYTITYYAIDVRCCGKTDGITSTGVKAVIGRTIAVDPSVIPYGTRVLIDGHLYTAEDCGGAVKGNHIDILVSSYDEAIQNGKTVKPVYVLKGEIL